MKPKIAPTSPKARLTDETLTELYAQKPLIKPGAHVNMWLILTVTIGFAILAGAVSPWLVSKAADQFPSLSWLTHLRLTGGEEKVIIRETPVKTVDRPLVNQEQLRPTLVAIYTAHATTDIPTAAYVASQAKGFGVVGTSDGVIVTTGDVVPDSKESLVIARSDGTVANVVSIVRDPFSSFVLLRTSATRLTAAKFAASIPTTSGTQVHLFRSGAPRPVSEVWNAALVDAAALNIHASADWLESTEAFHRVITVSPAPPKGWNGSPLLDDQDNVLGVWSDAQGGAVPLSVISPLVASLGQATAITRYSVGLQTIDLGLHLALPAALQKNFPDTGALVMNVQAKLAASTAGLKANDVITKVDTTTVDSLHTLAALLQAKKSATTVTLTILRDTQTQTLPLTLTPASP